MSTAVVTAAVIAGVITGVSGLEFDACEEAFGTVVFFSSRTGRAVIVLVEVEDRASDREPRVLPVARLDCRVFVAGGVAARAGFCDAHDAPRGNAPE